jgi:hypothetical protein
MIAAEKSATYTSLTKQDAGGSIIADLEPGGL